MKGPNVRKLIAHKMSLLMAPPGTDNQLGQALKFLIEPGKIVAVAREATQWVEAAIAVVRSAPDNPYTTDEEIAGAILEKIEKQKTIPPV